MYIEKQKKRLQQSRICPKAEENSETQWINDKFERLYEEYEDEFAEVYISIILLF